MRPGTGVMSQEVCLAQHPSEWPPGVAWPPEPRLHVASSVSALQVGACVYGCTWAPFCPPLSGRTAQPDVINALLFRSCVTLVQALLCDRILCDTHSGPVDETGLGKVALVGGWCSSHPKTTSSEAGEAALAADI